MVDNVALFSDADHHEGEVDDPQCAYLFPFNVVSGPFCWLDAREEHLGLLQSDLVNDVGLGARININYV